MLEEHENQETSLQDLIDLVERDDLPTNEFTIQDKDPMVILGKLNEVIAYLQTLQATINASDSKANEALQKAIQAVADATQALSVANGIDAKATQALANAIEAVSTANTALSASNTALSTANTAISTANTALSSANSAVETASNALGTAESAETKADTAITTANGAKTTAEGIDAKATTALANSQTAVSTANTAETKAQEALNQVVEGLGTKVYRDTQLLTTLDIKPIEDDMADNTTAITALQNGKVDKVAGKQLSTEDFTTAEKNKLAGLNNYDDTQVQADLSSNTTAITALQNGKVDKVAGKQLSTEDFTTAEKNKLAGLSNYDDTQVQADLSSLSSNITNLSNQVQNDFVKQGLVDINDCSTYDELYTALANSPNGTGVGDVSNSASTPIKALLPALPFSTSSANVYARIIAGLDVNKWIIELYTNNNISAVAQPIPTFKMQIAKNQEEGEGAVYRVGYWYNPATISSFSLSENGYIKYTNGLIIQWGRFTSSGRGIPVTFPIAFTRSVFAIAGSNIAATNTDTTSTIKANNVTTAGATFYAPYRGSGSSTGFTNSTSETFTWIAIGR